MEFGSSNQIYIPPFFLPKRTADRDARKAKLKEKKLHNKEEALRAAIKVGFRFYIYRQLYTLELIQLLFDLFLVNIQDRGIKLLEPVKPQHGSDSEDEGPSTALSSKEVTGAEVFLDEQGSLHWPVLFLYPEHQQTDFISAFCENTW